MIKVSDIVAEQEKIGIRGCLENFGCGWGTGRATLGLEEFDDGKRLDIQEAGSGVEVLGFVFEGHGAGKGDVLLATKDFLEN